MYFYSQIKLHRYTILFILTLHTVFGFNSESLDSFLFMYYLSFKSAFYSSMSTFANYPKTKLARNCGYDSLQKLSISPSPRFKFKSLSAVISVWVQETASSNVSALQPFYPIPIRNVWKQGADGVALWKLDRMNHSNKIKGKPGAMKQQGKGEKKNGNVRFYMAFYAHTGLELFLHCKTKSSVIQWSLLLPNILYLI